LKLTARQNRDHSYHSHSDKTRLQNNMSKLTFALKDLRYVLIRIRANCQKSICHQLNRTSNNCNQFKPFRNMFDLFHNQDRLPKGKIIKRKVNPNKMCKQLVTILLSMQTLCKTPQPKNKLTQETQS
jgi:hypothetical protein